MKVDQGRKYAISISNLSRRGFLKRLTAGAATICWPNHLRAQGRPATLHISDASSGRMAEDFTGLSYESSQLADPSFFSTDNGTLINLFRTLGAHSVLRLGGNTSEFTSWEAAGIKGPRMSAGPVIAQSGGSGRRFPITPKAIENLAGFLKAVDWKLIYGLNLAAGDAGSAVEEAAYVSRTVGERLIAFQLGNEPDMLAHDGDSSRRWTYEEFMAMWNLYYAAIHARLPAANIAGPDTAYKHDWVARFASDTRGKITLLTTHYYAEGPPSDPRMTIDYLLHTSRHFDDQVLADIRAARQSHLPYRMSEGNTCYSGGKAGVSDTFASALWVVDFMLSVAAAGGSGVNVHGGGGGLYTPIAGSIAHGFSARPIYYGMLLAGQFLNSNLLTTDLDSGGRDLNAYASSSPSGLRVVIINREVTAVEVQLRVERLRGRSAGSVWRLQAPSRSSKTGVTVANASVTAEGLFTPSGRQAVTFREGEGSVQLDPYSVALVEVSEAA